MWLLYVSYNITFKFKEYSFMIREARYNMKSGDEERCISDNEVQSIFPSGGFSHKLVKAVVLKEFDELSVESGVGCTRLESILRPVPSRVVQVACDKDSPLFTAAGFLN